MADEVALGGRARPGQDDRAFRRRALHRSWACPGAGFAFLGRRGAALLTYTASLGLLPAAAWVAMQPQATAAWVALGVFAAAVALSLAEQVACKWATPQPAGPRFLVGHFLAASILFWTAAGGALVAFFLGFGSLRMAGAGMSPTFEEGERFLFSKRVDPGRHRRGAVVAYRLSERSAWGRPGWLTVGRILAVPGDRLAIRGGVYTVNGEAGPAVAETRPYPPGGRRAIGAGGDHGPGGSLLRRPGRPDGRV